MQLAWHAKTRKRAACQRRVQQRDRSGAYEDKLVTTSRHGSDRRTTICPEVVELARRRPRYFRYQDWWLWAERGP